MLSSQSDAKLQLSEQLTAYFNGDWKSNANVRLSLSQAFGATQPLQKRLHDPKQSERIITTSSGPLVPHHITQGYQDSTPVKSFSSDNQQCVNQMNVLF